MRWSLCALLLLVCPAIAVADPSVTITSPASGAFTNSNLVRATVTGGVGLTVTMNGVTATVDDPNHPDSFSALVPLATQDPLISSNSTVIVAATDDVGSGSASVTFTFDDHVPDVIAEITSPPLADPNATTGFASLRIVGGMTDNDPNAAPVLRVRGSLRALTPSADAFNQRIQLASGANTILLKTTDRAGNVGSKEFQITRTIVCQDPNFPISSTTFTTYSVDRNDDLPDADLNDDVCDVRTDLRPDPADPNHPPFTPPRQKCTLRAAIQTANHHLGDDQILLNNNGVIVLRHQGAGEDAAVTGDLDVTENLRIVGNGRDTAIIDGSKLGDRVFDVHPKLGDPNEVHLQLLHLTVENGRTPKPADPNDTEGGGCLRVQGDLRTNSVAFLGCKSDGSGGAVLLEDANTTANMTCSIVARSQSKKDGGAIAVDEAQLTLRNSTLALNSAGRRGGAISALGSADPNDVVLTNVTMSQNKAKLAGGALDLGAGATAAINNCTFANNGAKAGSTLSTTDDGQATISNSILGDAKLACDPNSPELVDSMGGNVDRGETCILATTHGDQHGVDPKLDKLATNANGPPTLGLRIGSPAIDQGGTGLVTCEPLDARDVERGDWPRADNAQGSETKSPPFCDVGALELFVTPPD